MIGRTVPGIVRSQDMYPDGQYSHQAGQNSHQVCVWIVTMIIRIGNRIAVFSVTLGLGLKIQDLPLHDRIFKSRLVLVLVSNKINGLAKLRCSARFLVFVSKFKPWAFLWFISGLYQVPMAYLRKI